MNKQALIPLAIGLVVGIVALKIGYDYLNKMKNQNTNTAPVQKVVVAKSNLPLGTKLTENDLTMVAIPVKLVPDDAIKDIKDALKQTLKVSVVAKMPLLKTMIGPGDGLESIIPPGYRAVSVQVDEYTSVAGLLRPGARVDVLATFHVKGESGNSEAVSKLVLQNIEVRAVGQAFRSEEMESASSKIKVTRSVTLLVKTDQSEVLQLAASSGSIRLALRSATDDSPIQSKSVTLSQLLLHGADACNSPSSGMFNNFLSLLSSAKKSARTETKVVKPDEPYQVEVLTGTKSEKVYFASADSDQRVDPQKQLNPDQAKYEKPAAELAEVRE